MYGRQAHEQAQLNFLPTWLADATLLHWLYVCAPVAYVAEELSWNLVVWIRKLWDPSLHQSDLVARCTQVILQSRQQPQPPLSASVLMWIRQVHVVESRSNCSNRRSLCIDDCGSSFVKVFCIIQPSKWCACNLRAVKIIAKTHELSTRIQIEQRINLSCQAPLRNGCYCDLPNFTRKALLLATSIARGS